MNSSSIPHELLTTSDWAVGSFIKYVVVPTARCTGDDRLVIVKKEHTSVRANMYNVVRAL